MTKPFALIVEDDMQLSQIFSLALKVNFETETVLDGELALQSLAKATPDLIVLDLNLPCVNGESILDYIRSEARLEATNVIVATADARQAEMVREKADIILLKPVNPVQLRELATRMCTPAG
ncbi:MAG: response regulator [Chloroflexota bacterium]